MGYQFFIGLDRLIHDINNIYTAISVHTLRLETGSRIIRAADDSPDVFLSDYLRQLYKSYGRALVNVKEIFGAVRTFDDAIGRIYTLTLKIKTLVVSAANADYRTREQIQEEINEYVRNIKKIILQTEYDGYKVLNGDAITVHYGGKTNQYLIINGDKDFKNRLQFVAEAGNGIEKAVLGFENLEKTVSVGTAGEGTVNNPFIFTYNWNPDNKTGIYAEIWKDDNGVITIEGYLGSQPFINKVSGNGYIGTLLTPLYFLKYYGNEDEITVTGGILGDGFKTQTYYFSQTAASVPTSSTETSSENSILKAYDSISGEYSVKLDLGTVDIQVASAFSTLEKSIENIEIYIKDLDLVRGYYGALENKLQNIIETNSTLIDNWEEAENKVKNADLASEFANLAKTKLILSSYRAIFAAHFKIPSLIIQILNAPVGA